MKGLASVPLAVVIILFLAAGQTNAAAEFHPEWDQVANIKDAAERIGKLHRARGAKAAYEFIDACYRTHSLAENYGQAFESCIAQDYLETRMLAQVYSRLPPDALTKMGAPTATELANAMGRRVVAALAQYKMSSAYGDDLKRLVDEHGVPVFLQIVFPEAIKELNDTSRKERK
jgi:cytosine/adenosine deaminase-related metal-dependent hydrolase